LPIVLARALSPVAFDLSDARGAAAALLGGGAILSLLPGHAGLPCPLRTVTGVPCPLCGMTTGVEDVFRGRLLGALQANPGGPLAVAAAVVLLARRPPGAVRLPAVVLLLVLASMWLFELRRFSVL
jgi:hypothetical protein